MARDLAPPPASVGRDLTPPAAEDSSFLERAADHVGHVLQSFLPPTRGPVGAVLNAATGGLYGEIAPEHGGLYQPPEDAGPADPKQAILALRGGVEQSLPLAGFVAQGPKVVGARPAPSLVSRPLQSAGEKLEEVGLDQGRRVLTGGANPLSVKKPISDEAVRAAFDQGAIKPGGTVQNAADSLRSTRRTLGTEKGDLIKTLKQAGVQGPDVKAVAADLRAEAARLEQNSAGTGAPDFYRKIADELEKKANGGRLELDAAENIKGSLQEKAKYDKVQGDSVIEGARKDIASRVRQAVEDEIQRQGAAHPDPAVRDLASQFVPLKDRLGNVIEASNAASKGAAQAARRNMFSLRDMIAGGSASAAGASAFGPFGFMAGPATVLASHLARTRGTPTVAWTAYKLGPAMQRLAQSAGNNPTGRFGPLMQLAEQAGAGPGLPWRVSPAAAGDNSAPPSGAASPRRDATGASSDATTRSAPSPLEAIQSALQQNPTALGPHAQTLAAAARKGPDSVAQAHYVLSQTDPEYRAAIQRLTSATNPETP